MDEQHEKYHPSPSSRFDLCFTSTLQLMIPLITQSQLLLSQSPVVSQSFLEAVLTIPTQETCTVSLMNQLLLSGLQCRDESFYTHIPLMISKNGICENSL